MKQKLFLFYIWEHLNNEIGFRKALNPQNQHGVCVRACVRVCVHVRVRVRVRVRVCACVCKQTLKLKTQNMRGTRRA